MQSSLVKPSAISSRKKSRFKRLLVGLETWQLLLFSHTVSRPPATAQSSNYVQSSSAAFVSRNSGGRGTGRWGGQAAGGGTGVCFAAAVAAWSWGRRPSIRMFSRHMLLRGARRGDRRWRGAQSTGLLLTWVWKATGCTKVLISTTQREHRRSPRRAASVLLGLPSIFKCPLKCVRVQWRLHDCLNSLFFLFFFLQQRWISCFWGRAESGWEASGEQLEELLGRRESGGESRTLFTYPWGVHFPSASDALRDQLQHTVVSNATVRAMLVNKRRFQKKKKNAFYTKWSTHCLNSAGYNRCSLLAARGKIKCESLEMVFHGEMLTWWRTAAWTRRGGEIWCLPLKS